MADKTYRIKIVRGDQHFEAEGDKKFVAEMLQRFESADVAAQPSTPTSTTKKGAAVVKKQIVGAKDLSVGEFIRQFGFKKHTDFVLAFGYYLEHHSGLQSFTPADINNCYYEAKMESSNTSQMIIQNIRRGFMMQAKGDKGVRKRYTVTHSGEEHVKKALTKPKNT